MKKRLLRSLFALSFLVFPCLAWAQLPFSPCSPKGGKRADILSIETKYKAPGGTAPTFTIPAGTKSIAVYISSETGITATTDTAILEGDEDFLTVNAVIDLLANTSSGFVNYAKNTRMDGSGTNVYGWKNAPVGAFIPAGIKMGDATPDLNNVNFAVSGNTLTITESNTTTHSSYYVEYLSSYNSSLNPLEPQVRALLHGAAAVNRDLGIPVPADADIILISGKGTNSSAKDLNAGGGVEEGFSNLRIAIDLQSGRTNGFVTLANGGTTDRRSTYVISNQAAGYTGNLLSSPAITGDFASKRVAEGAVGVFNPAIYVAGGNLVIHRDADYARDFDDAYIVEFYTRIGEGMSAEFIDSDIREIAKGQGSVTGTSRTYKIPSGTNFIYFNETGNAVNADRDENENSLAAYGYIDLTTETVTGYFYQQVGLNMATRRDDNYAFKDVPLNGTSTRGHANTVGYRAVNENDYDISFTLSADKSELTITNKPGLVSNQYQFLLSADFYGSRPDIAFNTTNIAFAKGTSCKIVTANVQVCNPGSGNSNGGMPVSFYSGNPTVDPTAVLLHTATFTEDIAIGECKNFSFDIDLSSFDDLNIDMTMIINDNGSFVPGGVGHAVGTPFTLASLVNQGSVYKECYFDNNLFTQKINVNNCPVVNLDPDKSSGATGNYEYLNYFTAGNPAGAKIADADVSVVDPDAADLFSATITLANILNPGDEGLFLNGTLPAGITITGNGSGAITLSGQASQADYIAALKMIEYRNANGTPNTTNRTITTVLNDGVENGPASTTTIVILTSPRMNVTGNGITIEDNSTAADAADGTGFGVTPAGGALINHTFTIHNIGTGLINLTGTPAVAIASGDPGFTIAAQPAATAVANGTGIDFVISFNPAAHAVGTYTATISIPNDDPDAGRSDYTFVVSVAVNNPPAVSNNTIAGDEDQPLHFTAAGFTSAYNDIDNTPLDKIRVTSLPLNGSFRLNGTVITAGQEIPASELDNITFIPTPDWSGSTSFQWTASDGTSWAASPATATINIAPVNDAPAITAPASLLINENVPVALNGVSFSDIDAATGIMTATFTVPGGTLTASSGNGVTVGGTPTALILEGTLNDINAFLAAGRLTYAAPPNPPASLVLDIQINDNGNTGSGGAKTANASLGFGIIAANDPPAGTPDAPVTDEDVPVDGKVEGTDEEGDPLTFTKAGDPANGTVVVNTDGTYTYTPNPGYNGPDQFTVTISDGNGGTTTVTVNVTVNPVNDPPAGTPDAPVTDEDVPVDGTITATDPDSDPLTFTKAGDPANGTVVVNTDGTYTYTPNPGYNGPDQFTVTISDGNGGTTTVTVNVTVNPVNDPPAGTPDASVTDEDVPVDGKVEGTDEEGDPLTFTKAGDPANGAVVVNTDGTYTYTPNPGYNGPDQFTVTISDGNGGTTTVTVNVTVNPLNDTPTATPDAPVTDEDTPVDGRVTGTDPDSDPLTFTKAGDPANGAVVVNTDGTYTYTPNPGYSGPDHFTVTVSDGKGGTATVTVNVTVSPVNDPPVATPDAPVTAQDIPVSGTVTGIDPDGDPLTFTKAGDPANGTVVVNTDGTYTYSPNPGYSGTDHFMVTVSDGRGGTHTVTVNVTVNPGAPAVTLVKTATLNGNTVTYTFTIKNTGAVVLNTITLTDARIGITGKSIPVSGGLAPGASITHTETYPLTAADIAAGSVSNTAAVEASAGTATAGDVSGTAEDNDNATRLVLPIPQAQDNTSAVKAGNEVIVNVLDNDSPGDGGSVLLPATIEIVSQPANGTLRVNPDGTITYTPNRGFSGEDAFTYRVQNREGFWSNAATVKINVEDNPLEVPNVITPNGDGQNDRLVIKGLEKYQHNILLIFNRWGNKVYERRDYLGEWDGNSLNAGTYFYTLKVQEADGKWRNVNGYITLLR